MIKEIFHYLTMPARTRKRLRECVNIITSPQSHQTDTKKEIEKLIKSHEIGKAIDSLNNKGEELGISDKSYWNNLYLIAIDHKMRDIEMSLAKKKNNANISH